jgi:hypothetical protein
MRLVAQSASDAWFELVAVVPSDDDDDNDAKNRNYM